MIIFDPHPPYLFACVIDRSGRKTEHRILVGNDWERSVEACLEGSAGSDGIATVLHQGGELVVQPVTRVSEEALNLVRDSVVILPEHNEYTYRVCEHLFRAHPELPLEILCDTAFFSRLPLEASTYAVPEELRDRHVGRHGASGIVHEWAWRGLRKMYPGAHRCVSVVLGDHSNMAAIEDGTPIETTVGFTPVEGIPSITGCGDVDPMIVFELRARGLAMREINELLSNESGFSGMLLKRCGFLDVIAQNPDPKLANVRDIFEYSLLRHIGAMINVLGGADTILFETEDSGKAPSFIAGLCAELQFLEPALRGRPRTKGACTWFSTTNARTRLLAFHFNRWEILADTARLARMEASL